jgi:DNA polymerase III subunit delta
MIKFYFGDEKYLVFSAFQKEKAKFKSQNPDAYIGDFDFEQVVEMSKIREVLVSGGGLFSSKKMVIFRNVGNLDLLKQEQFMELLKTPEVGNGDDLEVLIVLLGKDKPITKLKGFLTRKTKREIENFEFKKKTEKEIKDWLLLELKNRTDNKVTIKDNALDGLILIMNGDLWRISNELEKLICFVGEGSIQIEDVEKICSGNIEAGVFDLVDAIGAKNLKLAMTLKDRLMTQGDNEFFVFSMIISQIRNLVKISSCASRGIRNPEQIANLCKIHPFVVKKTLIQLRSFPLGKLRATYELAAQIDKQVKSGQRDMKETLDYFIAKI